MKNKISFARMGYLLKQQTFVLRSSLSHLLLGTFIFFLCYFVFLSLRFWLNKSAIDVRTSDGWGYIALFIYGLTIALAYSMTFTGLETRVKRIGFLMTPCNPIEKYLSRVIIATVTGFVGILLTYFLADGVRMLLDWAIVGKQVHSTIPGFFNALGDFAEGLDTRDFPATISALALWVYSLTFFILCSSVFRTKAFIKGIGLYNLFVIIGLIIVGTILFLVVGNYDDGDVGDREDFFNATMVAVSVILWLFSALNVWWSYRNFKQSTIL
jgi:hypothetical protein